MDRKTSLEAADWLVRLEEDEGPQCRAEFFEWLRQSAGHVREFLLVTEAWRGLDGMDPTKQIDVRKLIDESRRNVVPLEAESATPPGEPRRDEARSSRRLLPIAAAIGALAVASWALWSNLGPRVYVTGVGEQRSFQLNDGSVLHLNARTRVEVDYSRRVRQLKLVDGEALFVVGRDPKRPFRVSAGAAIIRALGTQFNVYRQGAGAVVSVLEGKVEVSSGTRPLILGAGEEAGVADSGRAFKQARSDTSKAIAWRQRQLVFRDDPLAKVAAEFNRYNRTQIEVEGSAARDKQLVGVFDADDPHSLLLFLERDASLSVERDGGKIVIKSR